MIIKLDVPGAQAVASDEFLISWWTFILRVTSKHTLYTHADTLYVLNWTPTLSAEKI